MVKLLSDLDAKCTFSLLRLRQELTKVIAKHINTIRESAQRFKLQLSIYNILLSGLGVSSRYPTLMFLLTLTRRLTGCTLLCPPQGTTRKCPLGKPAGGGETENDFSR